jgi:hypothetical protein
MIKQIQIIGNLTGCPIKAVFLMISNIADLQENKNRRSVITANLGCPTSSMHYILYTSLFAFQPP